MFKAAENEFDLTQFDFTHAYSLFSSGNCSYRLKLKYGVPYLVAIRDTDINVFLKYKPYLQKRGYNILKNASKIFFLSPSYEEDVVNRLIPPAERKDLLKKCEIVPNGIDDFWLNNRYMNRSVPIELTRNLHILSLLYILLQK